MKKIESPLSLAHQLHTLHRNLRPDIQSMVRRVDFDDIDSLLELSDEAELTLEAEKSYREPLSPDQAILPESAYRPRGNKEIHTQVKVAAFPGSTVPPVTEGNGQNWITTLSKMFAEEVRMALQPTLNNNQLSPPPRSSSPRRIRRQQEGRKESAGDSPQRDSRPLHLESKKLPDNSAAKPKSNNEGICGFK